MGIYNLLEKTYRFAQLLIAINEIEYSKQNKAQLLLIDKMSDTKDELIDKFIKVDEEDVFKWDEARLNNDLKSLNVEISSKWNQSRKAHELFHQITCLKLQHKGLLQTQEERRFPTSYSTQIFLTMEKQQRMQQKFINRVSEQMDTTEKKMRSFSLGTSRSISETVETVCQPLILNNKVLLNVQEELLKSINRGLKSDRQNNVQCFPSYVTSLPTGNEKGVYLAIDFGATHLRIIGTDIDKDFEQEYYNKVTETAIKEGSKDDLFDFIVNSLLEFMKEYEFEMTRPYNCVFLLGFPMKNTSLDSGELQKWTRGYQIENVEGRNVKKLLDQAISKKRELDVKVVAMINDCTALLYGGARKSSKCKIGLILGYGVNASYVERTSEISTINQSTQSSYNEMIINTELGSFGDDSALDFIRTEWDKDLDKNTSDAGSQIFEKMTSKLYLGELVRLILLDLTNKKLIFQDQDLERLKQYGSIDTTDVRTIEEDRIGGYERAKEVLKDKLGMENVPDEDCKELRFVCECITTRSAHLVAATVAGLINKMAHKDVTIAVDGDLIRHHPHFKNNMDAKIKQLVGINVLAETFLEDAGYGAAILAANVK